MSTNTLSIDAYQRIKQDILEGRLSSDTTLSERSLAQRYDLSRTPLRAALATLEREGVVDRMAGGSALIRHVSIEKFLEIVDLRHMLESEAAAQAAQNGMSDELVSIKAAIMAYNSDDALPFDTFWQDDTLFHSAVLRAAELPMIAQLIAELRDTARRCTIVQRYENFSGRQGEHLDIIEGIEAGDPERTRQAMNAHFANIRERFMASLSAPSIQKSPPTP